jgi:[ribosomal protein S5]-alanine N-acetyltransferase
MTELCTPRLRLRRARMDDLPAIHAVLSDARAMLYWSTPPHREVDQSRRWLAAMVADRDNPDFVIERDGVVIGKAGCWRLPEIGFILHPDHWGRGLAREAVGAVVDHVFARFDVPAIIADVDPRNTASLALLGRLGFVETHRAERTIQVGDAWCDSVYLACARSELNHQIGAISCADHPHR